MAEEVETQETPQETQDAEPKGRSSMLWLLIAVGMAALATGAGFGLGRLLAGSSGASGATGAATGDVQQPQRAQNPSPAQEDYGYIEFEPIAVTLDGPRLDRYIRATVVLAIAKDQLDQAQKLIEKRKPELRNYLTVFFSGCRLEDVRGAEKLNRLRREIQDSLNEQLWPEGQPMISRVLFKEFAVQ